MRRVLFCIVIMSFWVSKAQEKWVLDSEKSLITYKASHFLHDWAGSNKNIKGVLIENDGIFQKIAIAICKFVEEHESFKKMDEPPACVVKAYGV